MFNPGYALFQPQAADALTYQPNKSSAINPEHLSFFKFVGRIIGKALHDQRILEAYFSRCAFSLLRSRSFARSSLCPHSCLQAHAREACRPPRS